MAETKAGAKAPAASNGDGALEGTVAGKFLSPDQILAQGVKLKTETVDVPEWGGQVIVSELTAEARDAYETGLYNTRRDGTVVPIKENVRAKLVVLALVYPDGSRMFADEQAHALGKMSGAVIDRLFDVAARLSGMSEPDVAAAKKDSESGES